MSRSIESLIGSQVNTPLPSNSIALTSTNNKGITLHPLHGVFAAIHRVTLPRGLLCKSLRAKWRCSDVRGGMDMVMGMRNTRGLLRRRAQGSDEFGRREGCMEFAI